MSSISSKLDLFNDLITTLKEVKFKYSLRFKEIANLVTNVIKR
jgi:hypothetical protein